MHCRSSTDIIEKGFGTGRKTCHLLSCIHAFLTGWVRNSTFFSKFSISLLHYLERLGIFFYREPSMARHSFQSSIVPGRTQSAQGDDQVSGELFGMCQSGLNSFTVVRDGGDLVDRCPSSGDLTRDPPAVGVSRCTVEYFIADHDDCRTAHEQTPQSKSVNNPTAKDKSETANTIHCSRRNPS